MKEKINTWSAWSAVILSLVACVAMFLGCWVGCSGMRGQFSQDCWFFFGYLSCCTVAAFMFFVFTQE